MTRQFRQASPGLDILLLGIDSTPGDSGSHRFHCHPALEDCQPLISDQHFDAIVVADDLEGCSISEARNLAPDIPIIAHFRDDMPEDQILVAIQMGADDVIFDMHLCDQHMLVRQILVARERKQNTSPEPSGNADKLTGLPDRQAFLELLTGFIEQQPTQQLTLMIVDIDAFQSINDSLGHEVGDELLKVFASRLREVLEPEDLCARFGPDHFAIVTTGPQDGISASILSEALVSAVRKPYQLSQAAQDIYITVSLGLTVESTAKLDAEGFVRQADIALFSAKQQGRSISRFEPELAADAHYKHLLRNNLHQGLDNDEFFIEYQPQISLRSGKIRGVEALLRWQHPSLGLIGPDRFIPLLEETGLITDVGFWVINQVCQQLSTWQRNGKISNDFTASINISGKQFYNADLTSFIEEAISQHAIEASQIKLEITESLLINDHEVVNDKLYRLKALGVSICIDDFGTGYASLSYLRQFPIDTLKIDKSFIQNLGNTDQDDAIVLAIINLAHDLDFDVIAEGVETDAQQRFLVQHNCDAFQGYLFSRPISPKAVVSTVQGHRPSAFIHVA